MDRRRLRVILAKVAVRRRQVLFGLLGANVRKVLLTLSIRPESLRLQMLQVLSALGSLS